MRAMVSISTPMLEMLNWHTFKKISLLNTELAKAGGKTKEGEAKDI
jgi:hypothetical protein